MAEQRLAEVQAEVEAAVAARQQPQRLPGPGGLSDLQVINSMHQLSPPHLIAMLSTLPLPAVVSGPAGGTLLWPHLH